MKMWWFILVIAVVVAVAGRLRADDEITVKSSGGRTVVTVQESKPSRFERFKSWFRREPQAVYVVEPQGMAKAVAVAAVPAAPPPPAKSPLRIVIEK